MRPARWRAGGPSLCPSRVGRGRSCPHLDACGAELALEVWNRNVTGMKYARGERRIHPRRAEHLREVLDGARTPRGHQGHPADAARRLELRDVIALADSVARHAIENDLARAAPLSFGDPIQGTARGVASAPEVARQALHPVAVGCGLTVHADHHALRAEALGERVDEIGI